MTRNTSLYGFQTSPTLFCNQNSASCIRITGSHTSPVVLCIKTAWLAPESLVSMGPRPHLSFCACKTNVISIRITSLCGFQPSSVVFACKTVSFGSELRISMGPRLHLRFFAFKTAPLAPELLVSMGTSPHLWFFQAKQRLLDQNYKFLWVLDLTCRFVRAKQRD